MTTDKRIASLKDACRKRDPTAFCQNFLPLYIRSPSYWLRIAREQRLIENLRELALIRVGSRDRIFRSLEPRRGALLRAK